MDYRHDIDGLRAIAVLAVILAHSGLGWLPGGFAGVDVFFVISGFLITGIILRDLEGGTFTFGSFYARRARRIFPALFVMLALTSAAAWVLLSPSEIKDFSASVFFSVLFLSNGYFADFIDYFAPSSQDIPLLHTWSLAIEEQFYLLFPLVAVFAWRRFGMKGLWVAVILLLLASFALAEWGWRNKPRANYFFSPSRFWEILSGALIALWVARRGHASRPALAALGLGAIFLSFVLYEDSTPFPSAYTVLPVVGAALVLLFGGGSDPLGQVLRLGPLRLVGLISFSAYLWHQPVFAFSRGLGVEPSRPPIALALIGLVLTIALISWRYVEQPFRHRSHHADVSARWQMPFLGGMASGLLALSVIGYATTLPLMRHPVEDRPLLEMTRVAASDYQRDIGSAFGRRPFVTDGPLPRVAVIGDSYARDFLNVLNEAGVLSQLDVSLWTISRNCAPFLLRGAEEEALRHLWDTRDCREYDRYRSPQMMQAIASADTVVLVSRWADWHVPYVRRTVENLRDVTDASLVLVGPKDFGQVSLRRLLRLSVAERPAFGVALDPALLAANDAMRQMEGVLFVDLIAALCGSDGLCPQVAPDGRLLSQDGIHLTPTGARVLGASLGGAAALSALFSSPHP